MTQTQRKPTPASVEGPAGPPRQESVEPSSILRPTPLTQNRMPWWTNLVVLAVSAALGAALSSLISFNVALWFVFTAVLHVVISYGLTRVKVNRRQAKDKMWKNLVYLAFLIALLPLFSVIWSVTSIGIPGLLETGFLASDMQGIDGTTDQQSQEEGAPVLGGIRHALVGSLLITLTATLISVPIGLMTSIYLVEYARGGTLSRAITFFVDVMTGIPSIVAGLFGAAAVGWFLGVGNSLGLPLPTRSTMGITAAIALSVLMIPVVVRTTEEMLRVVPNELREASYALGVRRWRTILKVVIPTAISGIAAGVTLAIARVIGETAPILVTAGFVVSNNWNLFQGWMTALPVYIFRQFQNPTSPNFSDPSHQRAWGAALVLIVIVMGLNLSARIIATLFAPKKSGR
jgi:phosphate transport system permease protein